MIQSMTGYASTNFNFQHISINLTVKTVNSRFFDFHSFISDDIQISEYEIKQLFEQKVQRGKISFKLQTALADDYYKELALDNNLLSQYIKLGAQIRDSHPDVQPFNLIDILNIPGVLSKNNLNQDELKATINAKLDSLIMELITCQSTEGLNLHGILSNKLNQMSAIIHNIKQHLPSILNNYKDKISSKLNEALADISLNEQRLAQEFAIFCQKIDIDEELSRLESHIKQFGDTINSTGLSGKKLDFISQEMLREANTLGSKSISGITTSATIELKVLIEQIKEQIQNIK